MDNFLPPDKNSIFYEESKRYHRPVPPPTPVNENVKRQQVFVQSNSNLDFSQPAAQVILPPGRVLEPTPNVSTAITTGIISLLFSISWIWWYGTILGIITACITLYLSRNGIEMTKESPDVFSQSGLSNLRTARALGIFSLCICGLWFIFLIAYFIFTSNLPSDRITSGDL